MSSPLEEFFGDVEEEFGVAIAPQGRDGLTTPGAIIDFLVDTTTPPDAMKPDEYRDHVAAVLGELMARALGITRYREDSRFLEDLRVR
jgi:hypothetical protein